ncbi:MAG: 4,5-DOPA dioxygenase extradiol [Bacteroidota bacterium]|jgi:4,5-DOPA dioxygenase extradiol|nr:4,5-DOPA dioxygenase extradiol [Ignavibacteria bacterium]MCU7501042.1 4,5-DOPA dioxygenase extradiol [Ignavibacteria bacterium]MCU7514029.1 4,5-DOPA dioxygenase extradiol [Ignavibacteria bacterium]MCU7521198.1 4,5-DOPA dioxygenase extradiol [Ignavibacteria bacterium]MCU7526230.1 4,5-DOPA dioxygenase extradiol [Ignavibacteria bacterium]
MNTKEFIKMTDRFTKTEKMPVLFVGHGSPMNAIEENEFVEGWREAGRTLPRPNAILCISAHWETRGTYVTAVEKPITIHDFGGFPRELYSVEYPAPGSPALAHDTREIITKTDVEFESKWGLDHGCWSVVKHMYPEADVPVVQLSLDHNQGPQYHYELAKELAPLRKKGVLIMGSGNMVHNLGMVAWDKLTQPGYAYDWALEASDKMKGYIMQGDHAHLINYKQQGTAIHLAVPTPEHYLPLLYALALKEEDENVTFFNDAPVGGSLTMTCVRIESQLKIKK